MLISHSMRFGTDSFDFKERRSLLVANEGFDATDQTNVDGFTITGSQPTGTERRIVFKIDNALYKFSGTSLVAYNGAGDFDDVIENGNTVAELTALTDIPSFVGKEIFPVIALYASADAEGMPSIKIALKVRSTTSTLIKNYNSAPRYFVADSAAVTPTITDITPTLELTGNGNVEVSCWLLDAEGNKISELMPIADAIGQSAEGIKFQLKHTVTTADGSDSAYCKNILVRYNSAATSVVNGVADIFSTVQNYETDLQSCYVIVKHDRLIDSQISAYVSFNTPPSHRELKSLGNANGSRKIFTLGDTAIDQSSLQVFVDGAPFADFDYDTNAGTIALTATSGLAVAASYDYNLGSESWAKMTQDGVTQLYVDDGSYMTRFTYTLADSTDKTVTNVRLRLTRPSGTVTAQALGKATGKTQLFVLDHPAVASSIQLPDADFSYDSDSQILTVVAPKNTVLTLSYDWYGEQTVIRSFAAGWIAA